MAHPAFDRGIYDPPVGPWPLVAVDTSGREPSPSVAELARILRARPGGS
jgi:hypothetical protein